MKTCSAFCERNMLGPSDLMCFHHIQSFLTFYFEKLPAQSQVLLTLFDRFLLEAGIIERSVPEVSAWVCGIAGWARA